MTWRAVMGKVLSYEWGRALQSLSFELVSIHFLHGLSRTAASATLAMSAREIPAS